MNKKIISVGVLALAFAVSFAAPSAVQAGSSTGNSPSRPKGPCDIYAAAGDPCVAAHSTTRALYAAYDGPLYQVMRQSDGKKLDIDIVQPKASPVPDAGGYADAAEQDRFCANTVCWIATVYDQSGKHNDLTQAPRGAFSGPAMGGFNNLPIADMAPVTIMGHKVYGVFIAPGMGLRHDDAKGTAVDDQAEGQYWVINGHHYNAGCCFDYGNAEIDSRDDDSGTMETAYFGDATPWYHGNPPGPWVMTDQENNLVGCVNPGSKSKLCATLPNITWRFVTGIAKGEPHHWTTLGGDARRGVLQVMYSGPRVDATYDPMRKQGAILLGNGGDNSHGSQGTFYEGAMTAAGTFPSDATDQQVQANIAAAHYDGPSLTLAPASAISAPPGLQTFTPGSSRNLVVTYTNRTGAPVTGVRLGLTVPKGWIATGTKTIAGPVAPDASVNANFKVTSGRAAFNGELLATATWADAGKHIERVTEKVRNVRPVKINEFRVSDGSPNTTNSFIELYNAGADAVDISGWTLTQHQAQEAIFSTVKIPARTKLAGHGFYLLGLANSGLVVPTRAGDKVIHVRSVTGMAVGDTLDIGTGAGRDVRKIAGLGTAAGSATTLWQPLPDGPVITIPPGATNVPVTSVDGFAVGQKIALGYGATYPAVSRSTERYEVAVVTAVGKPGTQDYLAADAAAGAVNIKVASVANISVGDRFRLDIDSMGHGIENVTVKSIGTQASRAPLAADAAIGATSIKLRGVRGFAVGHQIVVGTPANHETVTVTNIGSAGPEGTGVSFTPALSRAHIMNEMVVDPGTGLELEAPLKFNHAANLPFAVRGTGISFAPATAFAHSSNEPVTPLGMGVTLDRPLHKAHAIDAVVRDAAVTAAGYQGAPRPDRWFGGPALSSDAGNMVLRNADHLVVDSLNYGLLVDPWTSQGYQAASGPNADGCHVAAPGVAKWGWPLPRIIVTNNSAGRFPDGADTNSNCTDFHVAPATLLPEGSSVGTTNIKVGSVSDFAAGQTIMIDVGANQEKAVIAAVGTAGATKLIADTEKGATVIAVPLTGMVGFSPDQTVTIGEGTNEETAVIAAIHFRRDGLRVSVTKPLTLPHSAGDLVAGSGITLRVALSRPHSSDTQIMSDSPTPGAPNRY